LAPGQRLSVQLEKIWIDVHCPDFLVDEILIRAWKTFRDKGIGQWHHFQGPML
jgi:hypothetical protein